MCVAVFCFGLIPSFWCSCEHSGSDGFAPLVCVAVMSLTDASLTGLRVFRAVAEHGTLSAAAAALGYTQSAVSRQVAALERAAGGAESVFR